MKLWLCSQSINNDYDTFDSMVVAADNENSARETSPNGYYRWHDGAWWFQYSSKPEEKEDGHHGWANPDQISVKYLGEAAEGIEAGVICSSFNAG